MSSSTFSACLTPDPRLRRVIARSAVLFALIGVVLLWQLPYPGWVLWLATIGWLGSFARQLLRLRRGWSHCTAIRVLPGPVFEVRDTAGEWCVSELKSGSFLFARVAWLRLELADRDPLVELLLPAGRRCNNWRRLQVIWRHIGAS
ncbi:MAG: hypothetical protein AAFN50_10410 [Pseudomonadota bacterium]